MTTHVFAGSLTRPMPQYGAANGKGISRLSLDASSGKLALNGTTTGVDDSTWLVANTAGTSLYATCEVTGADQSFVTAYAIDSASGALTKLNTQPTGGNEACHASLSVDGRFLFVANYNGATPEGFPDQSISVFPIAADGSLHPLMCSVRHQGHGPNAERQTCAHAHCVIPSPDGRFVHVADLGIDRVVAYALADDGQLTSAPERDFAVSSGLGPRHIVFNASGDRLFMVSELIPTVFSFAPGASTHQFPIPSDGKTQPAGIVLSPDNRHLLISLRLTDEILGLELDATTGALRQTGRWSCGGATPRALAFAPSGRHVVVANQDADALTVFAFDPDSGTLGDIVCQQPAGTPMSIAFAAF